MNVTHKMGTFPDRGMNISNDNTQTWRQLKQSVKYNEVKTARIRPAEVFTRVVLIRCSALSSGVSSLPSAHTGRICV